MKGNPRIGRTDKSELRGKKGARGVFLKIKKNGTSGSQYCGERAKKKKAIKKHTYG